MYVTLLGRSNVGKSSIFNALLQHGKSIPKPLASIVSDKPGTTKDAKFGHFYIGGNRITLVDTGGIEGVLLKSKHDAGYDSDRLVLQRMVSEARQSVARSSLIFYIVDGLEGITPLDTRMIEMLRQWINTTDTKPEVKLLVNKMARKDSVQYMESVGNVLSDCYSLDLGDPFFVSARHKMGIDEVASYIRQHQRLNSDDDKDVLNSLEDMALTSESIPRAFKSRVSHPGVNLEEDASREQLYNEIDKSIRVCASVKPAFMPNQKWIKYLSNICGSIPFTQDDGGDYAIVPPISPAERLAKMYLPQNPQQNEHTSSHTENLNRRVGSDGEDVNAAGTSGHVDGEEIPKAPRSKVRQTFAIEPRRILVVGSVASCQGSLFNILSCGNSLPEAVSPHHDYMAETLSPNWHSVFTEWSLPLKGDSRLLQPVELQLAASLNLGGSLGRASIRQTRVLLRNCDVVILCADHFQTRDNDRVSLTKRELSWLTRFLRFHKPTVIVAPVGKNSITKPLRLHLQGLSNEFESVPIIPVHLSKDEDTRAEMAASVSRVKKTLLKVLQRASQMIETSHLNRWLQAFLSKWPPPWKDGSKVNVKFTLQTRANPPTFVIWSNVYSVFPQHYLIQLKTALSQEFGFQGVPLKFILRTTSNPRQGSHPSKRLNWRRKLAD